MKPDDALKVTQEEMDACCPCRSGAGAERTPCGVEYLCSCCLSVRERRRAGLPCRWPGHAAGRRRDAAVRLDEREFLLNDMTYMRDAARKAFEEAGK